MTTANIERVNKKDHLAIPERIAEILRHREEDNEAWKRGAISSVMATTKLARCMGERAWLLRLIGHLEPEKD